MANPPSTNNLIIGKGNLYIAVRSGGAIQAYEHMGNCASIEIENAVEKLPHYSSMAGLRQKDKNPVIQTDYMLNITAEEIAAENLRRFCLGGGSGNDIYAMQNAQQEYAMRYISNNPIGPNQTWDFWRGTLTPNGAMALIGEEWMNMPIMFEGLADTALHASSPYYTIKSIENTSTTTTTTS